MHLPFQVIRRIASTSLAVVGAEALAQFGLCTVQENTSGVRPDLELLGNLERGRERFLKTISRIAMIGEQAVACLPDHRPMFFHNCLPVMYLQVTLRFAVVFMDQAGPAGVSNETTSDRVSIII